MPHLPIALPKLHSGQAANVRAIRNGRFVAFGLELANTHNVAANAIKIMKAILSHRPTISGGQASVFVKR